MAVPFELYDLPDPGVSSGPGETRADLRRTVAAQTRPAADLGWHDAEVRDGLRQTALRVELLRAVVSEDPCEAHVEGRFEPDPGLPLGRAVRLRLDDGRSALAVVVGSTGRFHTVGLPE